MVRGTARSDDLALSNESLASKGGAKPLVEPKSASSVRVEQFRTAFFWPLTRETCGNQVGHAPAGESHDWQQATVQRLVSEKSPWQVVDDPLLHLPRPEVDRAGPDRYNQSAYGEYIYFHDFIQRVLFGLPAEPIPAETTGSHPLVLLQRRDICGLDVEFFIDDETRQNLAFAVERALLHKSA